MGVFLLGDGETISISDVIESCYLSSYVLTIFILFAFKGENLASVVWIEGGSFGWPLIAMVDRFLFLRTSLILFLFENSDL